MEAEQAWRPTRRLSHVAQYALWASLLVATPLTQVAQAAASVEVRGGVEPLTTVQPSSLIAFVWLLLVWLSVAGRRPRVLLTSVTAVVWVAVTASSMVALGAGVSEGIRGGVATAVQAGVTLAFYRWRIGDDNLTPHRPDDVTALALASVVGSVISLPISPAGAELVAGDWTLATSAWLVLGTGYVFVGASCLLLLVQRRPGAEAIPTRLADAWGLLVVTGLCIGVTLAFPDFPLSWVVLLPAVWAGLLMGPWSTAALALTASVAVVLAELVRLPTSDLGGQDVVDLLLAHALMAAFVLVALLLSLGRDQRAHLAQEVIERRREALDQAGLLRTLFESLDEALLLLDTDGRVQLHNRAARVLFGEDRLSSEPAKWLRHRGSSAARFSYSLFRDDDEAPRIVSVQLAPVPYAGADGVMAVARDVTHEHRRIEELASFAAVAAHDLKSPLAAVEGWLEVAEDVVDLDAGRARHAMERGRHAASRMASEIDDWLAYTVAREGELSPEPVALSTVLREVAATHPGVDFDFEAHDVVLADRTLLRHLLANLVGNAVKYTQPGQVPQVRVSSRLDSDGWVELQVVDAGIGIPAGEETAVFEPFRRATTVHGSYEGSGLGLALCKRIVRRHGGAIAARRNGERPGTTITMTLPADRADDAREGSKGA